MNEWKFHKECFLATIQNILQENEAGGREICPPM